MPEWLASLTVADYYAVGLLLAGTLFLGWRAARWRAHPGWPPPDRLAPLHCGWMDMGLFLCAAVLLFALLASISRTVLGEWILAQSDAEVLTLLLVGGAFPAALLLTGLPFLEWVRITRGRTEPASAIAPPPRATWGESARVALRHALYSIPPVTLAWYLGYVVLRLFGMQFEEQDLVRQFATIQSDLVLVCAVVFVVVLVPLAEEVFFRGIVYRFLRAHLSRTVAIVVSATFFAAMHLHLPALAPLFVLGVFLAVVVEKTGSVRAAVILHGLFNLNTAILLLTRE